MTLRTPETEERYQRAIREKTTIPLLQEPPLMEWKYWRLIKNRFPHDKWYKEHDLLIPLTNRRSLQEVSLQELMELLQILKDLEYNYDSIKLNLPRQQSIKNSLHFHLGTYK